MQPEQIDQLLRATLQRMQGEGAPPEVTGCQRPDVHGVRPKSADGEGALDLSTAGISGAPAVTLGFPGVTRVCWSRWVGRRLCWWPNGIPSGRRISLLSSRLGRQLDLHVAWFAALRTTILRMDPAEDVVCTVRAAGMRATHVSNIVDLAAQMFGVPRLKILVDDQVAAASRGCNPAELDTPGEVRQWLETVMTMSWSGPSVAEFACYLSPPLTDWGILGNSLASEHSISLKPAAGPVKHDDELRVPAEDMLCCPAAPLADRLSLVVAQRLCVLSLRRGGHMERLLRQHLADDERREVLVYLVRDLDEGLPWLFAGKSPDEPADLFGEEAGRRVIPWFLFSSGTDTPPRVTSRTDSDVNPHRATTEVRCSGLLTSQQAEGSPLSSPADWLLHWTRPRKAPWPDQSSEDWLAELILGCATASRSAVAVLLRILDQQRIRASAEAIRGQHEVVAFTEVPLAEFRSRRRFRSHRHRYDFEPWGIAIRREALIHRGARRVVYGDEDLWNALDPQDQPWFQKQDAAVQGGAEFAAEREWRIRGDVDLSTFADGEVMVFVDTALAAEQLRGHTSLPLLTVPY